MGVRLPSAYQEVEYIESTGTQIIDTDYLPVGGDEMSIELSFSSYPPRGTYYCFAATDNSDPQVQLVFGTEISGKTLFYKYFSTGDAQKLRTNFAVDTIYRIDVAANGDCACNGVTGSPINNLGYATGHLRFFARMAGNVNFYGRLYKFVASHDGIEKVNLVPCYRKADDEAGLYDLVSGTFFTNAGTGEFLVGADVIDSIIPWLVARRRWIMAAASRLIKRIVTGVNGVVNFVTKVKKPMKVTCEFSPVQEGTGDPSPTNVRPISGWTGANILAAGVNILGTKDENGYFATYIPANTAITISEKASSRDTVRFYRKDKTQIVYYYLQSVSGDYRYRANLKIVEPVYYVKFDNNNTEQQCCFGTDLRPYKLPSMTNLPINWQSSAGTIYGGTVTLNEDGSADLVSDVRFRTLVGTESWATEAETGTYNMKFKLNLSDMMYGSNITNALTNYIKRRESQNEGYKNGSLCCQFGWNDHRIFVLNATKDIADVSDLATWKAYLADHPLEIVYSLTTPTTYHFDSIGQLQSFLGNNAVWHDMNGQITVEYYNYQ